jgi:hypothetical protein
VLWKQISSCLLVLAVVVFSFSLSSQSFAGKGGTNRPFKGVAKGTITKLLPPDLEVEYTGNATHLGRFTRFETAILKPDGSVSGSIDYVAANGDELFTTFSGSFVNPTTATGTYTITGGTGRFEGATGTATFEAVTDFQHVDVTFDGTISY